MAHWSSRSEETSQAPLPVQAQLPHRTVNAAISCLPLIHPVTRTPHPILAPTHFNSVVQRSSVVF